MQHGFGLLSDVLCDFWDLFHGWLHTVTSPKTNTRFSTFLMILLIKLLWNMFKRVYVTFLEWYPIIYAWVCTEIWQLTTILKVCPKDLFPLYLVNRLIMIPVHDFAKCVKVRVMLYEISRLTEQMWSEYCFSFTEGEQNSWINLYGFDYVW